MNHLTSDFKKILEDGSVCLLIATNSTGSVVAYVGCIRAGVPQMLISDDLEEDRILYLVDKFQVTHIWTPLDKVIQSRNFETVQILEGYALQKTKHGLNGSLHPDLALLIPTSGSTGSPNMVRQSAANIQSNTNSIVQAINIGPDDVVITTLPMNYTYGLSIINTHLQAGAAIVLNQYSVSERKFWKRLGETPANSFGGVPYTYEILNRLGSKWLSEFGIRKLTQAGGRLDPRIIKKMSAACAMEKVEFYVMYGQTEATARMAVMPPVLLENHPESVGIAIPGGSFQIEDEFGDPLPWDNIAQGELIYYGDNVSLGYAENFTDLSKGDENGGRLATGDIARIDEKGLVYIVGRAKRFIKLLGKRINLDDVDRHLEGLGLQSATIGDDTKLVIYLVEDNRSEQLLVDLSEWLSVHPSLISIVLIEEIPRSESGKILYSRLVDSL